MFHDVEVFRHKVISRFNCWKCLYLGHDPGAEIDEGGPGLVKEGRDQGQGLDGHDQDIADLGPDPGPRRRLEGRGHDLDPGDRVTRGHAQGPDLIVGLSHENEVLKRMLTWTNLKQMIWKYIQRKGEP